jgi:ParB family chromosome partitioning protein
MRPAVELSYLSQEHQQALLDVIEDEERTPSHVQAVKLRKFSEEGRLSNKVILSVMQEDKPTPQAHFKLPNEKIRRFFPADTSAKVIEETIIKALEMLRGSNK